MAAQSRPIPLAAAGSGVVYAGQCSLRGFWLLASATAATVTLYDNALAASGTVLAQWVTTAVNQDKEFDINDGARCENGIYVSVSTGTVTGNVRIG